MHEQKRHGDSEQAERLLLQAVTDYAIYMLDPEGYIRSWNPGGELIKGYTDREILGQHFSIFYTPDDIARRLPWKGLEAARQTGRYEAEGWRVRKDGSLFRANVIIDPIWQDGRLVGFAKVTRDVTEKYEAIKSLRETERALAQSQKLEALGRLALGVAHDFNNVLAVIVNSLDLLAKKERDERKSLLINAAAEAAQRGSHLSHQLLAFTRGQHLRPAQYDVNELIRNSFELFRRAAGDAVRCTLELAERVPPVMVDRTQLEAAVMNLVANARDASPAGHVVVRTRVARLDRLRHSQACPDRDYVCVSVADDGPGMPEEIRLRAMEPFFTTKDVGKGSGLGLSQVFGFASQSGGFAEIDSLPDAGTTVTMFIPELRQQGTDENTVR
ncbi:two-component system sensor histidine kinase NtrB [[Pseudomonas] boreopolis]|jgi:PAS domain S-box-containing protein|uniref:two-component system sensor histidine kinase NtrB n=1 Tax=Xanthomonas boreopolis TaxID=86183 RepID=UPI003D9BF120